MNSVIAVSALALLLGSAPAAAEQARAVLSVTAVVVPACAVERGATGPHRADIACSTAASVSTMTAARHEERPLAEAEALLGAPVRGRGGIVFSGPVSPASTATADVQPDVRYLTVTY